MKPFLVYQEYLQKPHLIHTWVESDGLSWREMLTLAYIQTPSNKESHKARLTQMILESEHRALRQMNHPQLWRHPGALVIVSSPAKETHHAII
jgi:hypothetical protein